MKQFYAVALAAAVGLPAASSPVLAQDAPSRAAQAAISHFRAQSAAYTGRTAAGSESALRTADVDEFVVQSEAPSMRAGVRHVYLRQAIGGIPVANGLANATVREDGEVVIAFSRMVAGLDARRSGAETPSLTPESAIAAAAAGLGLEFAGGVTAQRRASAAPGVTYYDAPDLADDAVRSELVYFATDAGPVRLAYDLYLAPRAGEHMWLLKVDAETGAILHQQDLVEHENHAASFAEPAAPSFAPLAAPSPLAAGQAAGGATYRVSPYPFAAPDVSGGTQLVGESADPVFSPDGWHQVDGQSFTSTRGNNVQAYEDRSASNSGLYTEGGASLTFDFPFSDTELAPPLYTDAAVTNLFYWNNIIHDVTAAYGFDEASGNFQAFNYTGVPGANDPVRAEAQDGSGTNNANFGTPSDGSRPRMQMFEWTSSAFTVEIESDDAPDLVGAVPTDLIRPSGFDPVNPEFEPTDNYPLGGLRGELAAMQSSDSNPLLGCGPAQNDLTGKIAIIQRGECFFVQKFQRAQDAGAIGVIIYNAPGSDPLTTPMGGPNPGTGDPSDDEAPDIDTDVSIPGLLINDTDLGLALVEELDFGSQITVGIGKLLPDRDSDFDAGVIAHEYGHGISNRLTGGRLQSGCLVTVQQMGEGWSDFYGLMLTQHDPSQQTRGVGTYLIYEDAVEGTGIRPAPYSPDMGINPVTYGDVRTATSNGAGGTLRIPHGVGYAYNSVLWDLAWLLVDEYGGVGDVAAGPDAEGADYGGFNVATALVTESLKIQPCSPGQLDGRDAMVAADAVLFDGAHAEQISAAFTRRGYGENASQGTPNTLSGISEDFTPLQINVANEEQAEGLTEAYRVSDAFPNPASDRAALRVEVREAQDVTVEVFDVMGRRVALLHDGPMAAAQVNTVTFATGALAPGAYVVRVRGEQFQATRRVTLAR